jgi:YD repeat-containing protein
MVAIVSGNSLGLNQSSLAVLGSNGRIGNATQGRSGEAAYVNVSTGNLVLQDLDSILMGRGGSDVANLRTYNSQGSANYMNADGWRWGQYKSISAAGTTLTRTDADGSTATYLWDSASQLYVQSNASGLAVDTIAVNMDGSYAWTDGSTRATEIYAAGSGLIESATDSSGNTTSFTYNADNLLTTITDADGEAVHYAYTDGNLTQISTSLSGGQTLTQINYAYDSLNRLTSVSVVLDPSGALPSGSESSAAYVTTYAYDGTSTRVTSVGQSDGSQLSFTYVLSGGSYKVASVTDADGGTTSFAYSGSANTTTVTDALGVSSVFAYSAAGQLTQATYGVTSANAAGLAQAHYAYNALGELTSVSGATAENATMEYDARGNLIGRTLGSLDIETWTYDDANQVRTYVLYAKPADPVGQAEAFPAVTRYIYAEGNPTQLRFVVTPEGDVTEYRYNAAGLRTSTLTYPAVRYDTSLLEQTDVPTEADMAAWSVSQDQTRLQRQDLAYDFRGQLQTSTSYANLDASGNGIAVGAMSTQYVYDQRGALLQTVSPDGDGVTQFIYDALGRVVSQTARSVDSTLSQTTITQYDDANGKTTVTLANGLTTTSAYDPAGRLVSVTQSSGGSVLGVSSFAYDADGRLLMSADATGQRAWTLYDAAGRKVADIDATGRLIEYVYGSASDAPANEPTLTIAYDTAIDVSQLVDSNGEPTTALDVNAGNAVVTLQNIRPAASAQDGKTWSFYDDIGRLTNQVDALGYVTEFRYEGASRLMSTMRYATPIDTTQLSTDGAIRPYLVVPDDWEHDRLTSNFYDHDGLLRLTIDSENYPIEYFYDAAGRLVRTTQYANTVPGLYSPVSRYLPTYNAHQDGSIAGLLPAADPGDVSTYNYYNARGQLVGKVDAGGFLTEIVYDDNGRVAQTIRYASPANGPVTETSTLASLRPQSSSSDQVSSSTWDALGRLATQTNVEGTITRYAYNEVGQLTGTTTALNTSDERTVLSRYDVQGRLVASLSPNGAALIVGNQTQAQIDAIWDQYASIYTYDAAGRRTSSTDADDQRTVYFYDDDGRLRYTVDASSRVVANNYDALGHLISTSRLVNVLTGPASTNLQGGLLSASANQDAASALAFIASGVFENSTNQYAYDANGQLVQVVDPLGGQTAYSFDAFGDQTSETRTVAPGQTTTTTHTYDRRGLDVSDTVDADQVGAVTRRDYDAFGRVIHAWDADGNETVMGYDALGRMVSVTDSAQSTRTMTYDAFDRVVTQTDARGAITTYSYDTAQRSITVTTPEGVVITTTHSREGQTRSIVDGNGHETTYVYDGDGNLLSTTSELGTSSALYDRADRLNVAVDADGNVVSYIYNASNQLVSRVVDPDGLHLETTYLYDSKGQQIVTTDPNGVVTLTTYDLKGEVLTQTVDPNGLNLVTSYSYDGVGRVLTTTSPGGNVTQYTYDGAGRRTSMVVDPDGLALTTWYSYDDAGNLITRLDPTGERTFYFYDALGRPTFTVDGEGDVSENRYDANGNVSETIRYANRLDLGTWNEMAPPPVQVDPAHDDDARTVYDADDRAVYSLRVTGDGTQLAVVARTFDGNGNVVGSIAYAAPISAATLSTVQDVANAISTGEISNPSVGRSTRNVYDAAGHLTWSVDGLGDVTQRFYDPNGQLVKLVAYANRVGQDQDPMVVVASGADRVSLFAYDAAGRQTFMVDALGGVTKLVYDADGNVTETIAYSNRLAAPDINTATMTPGLLTAAIVPSQNDRITRAVYDGANRQVFAVDAEGGVTQSVYDGNGRVIARIAYAAAIATTSLPDVASVSDVALILQPDAVHDRTTLYAYDAAGRQIYSVDALGYVTASEYDGLGRLLSTTLYGSAALGLGAGATAVDVAVALGGIGATTAQVNSFAYDAVGNLLSATDALGHSEHTTYDGLGSKLSFTNKLGAVWTYEYDAAGRLVAENAPSSDPSYNVVTTRLVYDALGDLTSRIEAFGTSVERTTSYAYDALGRQVATYFPPVGVYDAADDVINGAYDPYGGGYGGDPYGGGYGGDPYGGGYGGDPYGGSFGGDRVEIWQQLHTQVVYDAFGDAVANVDVSGNISVKAYDKLGQVVYDMDAEGYVTRYDRDSFGDVSTLTRYAAGTALHYSTTLDNIPAAAAIADAVYVYDRDRTITTQYDKLGRAVLVTQPSTWVYNGNGQSYQASEVTRTSYNAFGQVVQSSALADLPSDTWATTTSYYDLRGDKTASVDAMGYLTAQSFDAAGNVTAITEYANAVSGWTTQDHPTPVTSGADRSTTFAYDAGNRKVSQTWLGVVFSSDSSGTSSVGNLTTTYGYDALGNLTRTTDALGGSTYTYYDALGRISAVAAPARTSTTDGQTLIPLTVFIRDVLGNVVRQTEYGGGAIWADESGYDIAWSNPYYGGFADRVTSTTYDSHGNAVEVDDANGAAHYMSYDAAGHLAKSWQTVYSIYGEAQVLYTEFQYDGLGRQIAIITPASTSYVSQGNLQTESQSQAGSTTTYMGWNAFGEMVERNSNGVADRFDYDNAGRVWRTDTSDGISKVSLYDLQGHQTAQIASAGSVGSGTNLGVYIDGLASAQAADALGNNGVRRTDSQVDLRGRVVVQTLPSRMDSTDAAAYRPVVYQTYDRWGNVLTQSDVRNANWVTQFVYNANNQVIQETQPDGNGNLSADSPVTQIYYDALGRQVATRDANGNLNRQTWDGAGQLATEIHADGGVITHSYDTFGDQIQLVDAMGNVTKSAYDNMGRNVSVTNTGVGVYYNDGEGVWGGVDAVTLYSTYDQAGRKIYQDQGTGRTSYIYDARGNVLTTIDADGYQTRYAYDVAGHQVGELDANGNLSTWNYDSIGRLYAHTDIGGAEYWFHYDNANQLIGQGNSRGQNLAYAYDAAGQLVQITDNALGQTTNYAYNAAGQHVLEQTVQQGTTYQNQTLGYDTLGRLALVNGMNGLHLTTTYDKVGNKLSEQVNYTTTHTSTVADYGNVQVGIDESGNPIYELQQIGSHYEYESTARSQTLWSAFDSMNRQIMVDGALNGNASDLGNITSTQGHLLGYDKNGNRTQDRSWGTLVTPDYAVLGYDESGNPVGDPQLVGYSGHTGIQTTWYGYDTMNRLSTVSTGAYDTNGNAIVGTRGDQQAIVVDTRLYDAASRVLQSGPSGSLPAAYVSALVGSNTDLSGATTTTSRYDPSGRLLSQHVVNEADTSKNYDAVYDSYDAAGNLLHYSMTQGEIRTTYSIGLDVREGYKQGTVSAVSTNTSSGNTTSGTTTDSYDANGYLIGVTDSAQAADNRSFINDAIGHVLRKTQQGNLLDQLVVSGNVVGTYGYGVDPNHPVDGNGNPNYVLQGDFDLAYRPVTNSYPAAATGQYPVQSGDTLQSIAQGAYGDSSLWYLIADANGLSGNQDLRVGQILNIPTKVGATHNSASTYAPYDPSKVVGSTSPNLPTPAGNADSGGCGALGTIIMVVVAVVVTIYTAGAAAEVWGAVGTGAAGTGAGVVAGTAAGATTFGTGLATLAGGYGGLAGIGAAALGGAVGSIASQAVGNVIGAQDGFNWSQVGVSALAAGFGAEVGAASAGTSIAAGQTGMAGAAAAAARTAIATAATQAVASAVGLRTHFNWATVAAAAVGSAVGSAVGDGASQVFGSSPTGQFATAVTSGFAAGYTTAVAKGGRVNVQQVATDAFGNALGSSIAHVNLNNSSQGETELTKFRRSEINDMNWDAKIANALASSGPAMSEEDYWNRPPSLAQRYVDTYGGELVPVSWKTPSGQEEITVDDGLKVDEETSRRDPSLDDQFPKDRSPSGGTVLGYRDKNGPYYRVYHDGRYENVLPPSPSDVRSEQSPPVFRVEISGVGPDSPPVNPPTIEAPPTPQSPLLPEFNPGTGQGVYLGAQSATDAMYTRAPALGPYGQLTGSMPGFQAHHLNQGAVYNASIPYRSGQSILLPGDALHDAGSAHYEAHASLENWWDSYRTGENRGSVPTNSEYGQGLRQSLIDAGMSPVDATQYSDVARQQRLASGLADDAPVSRVPRRMNQPGGNVVDADLWAARGLAKNLAVVGRGLTAVGAAADGYSLYSQYQQSAQTGNYTNTYREGVRIAGGWAGAYAVGAAGAEFGAGIGLAFSPVGAVIGGFIGGVIGGGIGYFTGSYASVGIATDVGLLPPGTPR